MLKLLIVFSHILLSRAVSIMFLVLICSLFSRSQNFSITGKVTSTDKPISAAMVILVDKNDTTKQITKLTDALGNYTISVTTSVELSESLPSEFELGQNYPNPFSASTAISYELNTQSDVQMTIYDVLGKQVKKFSVGNKNRGVHGVQWDARNDLGVKLASGVYFYSMQVGSKTITKKMIVENSLNNNYIPSSSFSVLSDYPKQTLNKTMIAGSYQIRINNGNKTLPLINPKVIDNVFISKDTIINITVEKKSLSATADVYIDSVRQIVRGFGAANILPWRPDMTTSEIETAFGSEDGQLGFTILRLMVQPDSNQWSMNVASAKKAHELGAIVFASPWNAPPILTDTANNQIRVRPDKYGAYAKHLNSFNSYMKNNGAPLYAISVQNEPDYANDWTGWTPNEMFTFMKEQAHTIDNKIIAPESFQFRRNMSDPILNDSVACANLDIVGAHIYGGGLSPYPLAAQKGKEVWMTEHLTGETSQSNDWTTVVPVASEMHNVLNAGMSAYIWWYLVRYYGPMSDETGIAGPKGTITKKGYAMSQFARFIRPGYHIIKSTSSRSSVNITAAADDLFKVVIVATNTDTEPIVQTFNLKNSSATKFITYTTTSTKNCLLGNSVTVQNGSFSVTLEPSSITTFVSY